MDGAPSGLSDRQQQHIHPGMLSGRSVDRRLRGAAGAGRGMLRTGVLGGGTTVRIVNIDINPMALLLAVAIVVLFICAVQQFTIVGWIALGLFAGLVIRLVELYRLVSAQASANRAMTRLLGINPSTLSYPYSPSSPPLPIFHRVSPTMGPHAHAHASAVPSSPSPSSDQSQLFTLPGFPSAAFAPLPHTNQPATIARTADLSQGQATQLRPSGQLHGATREGVQGMSEGTGSHALSWQAGGDSQRGLSEAERQQLQRLHQQLALQLSLLHRELVAADYPLLSALDVDNPPAIPPLSNDEIERLPLFAYSSSSKAQGSRQSAPQGGDAACSASPAAAPAVEHEDEGSGVRCMVCLEDLKDGEMARLLPCFHKFHSGCISPWLRQQATCPLCKHQVAVH